MKKTLVIFCVICLATWLLTCGVSAQTYNRVSEKNVKLVRGKKLVLTGAVMGTRWSTVSELARDKK